MSIFVGTKTGAFSSYPDARTRETEWYCSQSANFKDLPATSLQWQVSFDFLDEHGMREPLAAVGSFNTPGYAESLMPTSSLELCTPGVLSNYPTPQGSFRSSSGTLATSPSTHSGGEAPRFEVGDIVQVRGMILGNTSKEREYEDWVNGIVVEAEEYPNFDLAEEYAYQVNYDQIRAPINNATCLPPKIWAETCMSQFCCHSWKAKCLELGGKPLEVKRETYVFFQILTRCNGSGKSIWVPGRCISANHARSEYWIQAVGGPNIGWEYWTQGPFNACTSESLERMVNGKEVFDLNGWDRVIRCSCS